MLFQIVRKETTLIVQSLLTGDIRRKGVGKLQLIPLCSFSQHFTSRLFKTWFSGPEKHYFQPRPLKCVNVKHTMTSKARLGSRNQKGNCYVNLSIPLQAMPMTEGSPVSDSLLHKLEENMKGSFSEKVKDIIQIYHKHIQKTPFNSLMRELVRCYKEFNGNP